MTDLFREMSTQSVGGSPEGAGGLLQIDTAAGSAFRFGVSICARAWTSGEGEASEMWGNWPGTIVACIWSVKGVALGKWAFVALASDRTLLFRREASF